MAVAIQRLHFTIPSAPPHASRTALSNLPICMLAAILRHQYGE